MPRPALRLLYPLLLVAGIAALGAGWVVRGAAGEPGPGHYVEGVIGQTGAINPLLADEDAAADIAALVFSGLMRIRGDGLPEPDLAERWEVTPDGLTYTFHLRRGVSWHDGQPFDADDVAFTIGLLQSPEFPGNPALAAPWQHAEVFVADRWTVLVHLEEPSADFLTHAAVGILPRHLLAGVPPAELGSAAFNGEPAGTGPYRLEDLDERHAVLERNTSYHLGAPDIERIELRFFDSPDALTAALADGDVDAGLLPEGRDPAAVLEVRDDLSATTLRRSAFTLLYINNQVAPLDDAALRRALVASVNLETLLDGAGVEATPGEGVIVPGSWAYTPPMVAAQQDVAAAWAAAGWSRGRDGIRVDADGRALHLTLLVNSDPVREALAEGLAEQLERQGVGVTVEVISAAQLLQQHLQPRRYELAIFGWEASPDPDPYPGWHASQVAAHGRNIAGLQDPQADALLEAGRQTLDVAERRDLYARFAERFRELAPSLVLYYPERAYVHPAGLEGLEGDALLFTPASRFYDVHRWRLTAD